MKPKKIDSLRQEKGSSRVVRLLTTKPLLDKRWLKGVKQEDLKKYLIVRYDEDKEDYLPVWKEHEGEKVIWWDPEPHDAIKAKIVGYKDNWNREEKDQKKKVQARKEFAKATFEHYHTDDWDDAQQKYMDWCATEGIQVEKMRIGK